MQTAKIFTNGKSQAVRLPKNYRFKASEVGVTRVGSMVILYPKDDAWENFLACEPVTDDFVEAVLEARKNDYQRPREEL
jgi:antitoxin VapB